MAYLKALNAGCQFPVASFAEFFGDDGSESGKCESVAHEKCANRITKSLKIRGIYWDEKSEKLLRAECLGSIDLSSADCVQHAKNLGVALAQKIQKQL
jgi:hydroxymethylbilane synthase